MEIKGKQIVERMESVMPRKYYADKLGIPEQTISNWCVRNVAPKSKELYAIAVDMGVSMEWLLTGEERKGDFPSELLKFRSLNAANRNAVVTLINALYEQEGIEFEKKNASD